MSFTIVGIQDPNVYLKCHANQTLYPFEIRFIFSPDGRPVTASMLMIGDILKADNQNYLHMQAFTTNRLYETAVYLQSAIIRPWFSSYFPYIRPFESANNNLNYVIGIKIIEYTYFHSSIELFEKIIRISPELEEILNFFLAKTRQNSIHAAMVDSISQCDHVSSILHHCLFRLNSDIESVCKALNIKLTIVVLPYYSLNLINPSGEIAFNLLLRENKYEVLYSLHEKKLIEGSSALSFIKTFDKTQHEGYCIDDLREKNVSGDKKVANSFVMLDRFVKSVVLGKGNMMAVIQKIAKLGLLTEEISEMVRIGSCAMCRDKENLIDFRDSEKICLNCFKKISCFMCKNLKDFSDLKEFNDSEMICSDCFKIISCVKCNSLENLIELKCLDKICETCFRDVISESTNGLFVLNEIEEKVDILCVACGEEISDELIKNNLKDYEEWEKKAVDRIQFNCDLCGVNGKLDVFLTDCRHTCKTCTIDKIRENINACEICAAEFSQEVIQKFMKLDVECNGCAHEFNWIKAFSKKYCDHLLCLNCVYDIYKYYSKKCYEGCPEFNLSQKEFENLFLVKCSKCEKTFNYNVSYWSNKNCQCRLCLDCMLSYKDNLEICSSCKMPFTEKFASFLKEERNQKDEMEKIKINCPICCLDKPMIEILDFMSCECKICKTCFEENLKNNFSDISLIDKVGLCPICEKELKDEQLEKLLTADDWDKLTVFKYQKSNGNLETCPKCKERFEPGLARKAVCISKNCNYSYCLQCKEAYHEKGDCDEVFIQQRIEMLKNEPGGVTQCPRCRFPYIKDPKNCEHATCLNSGCGIDFCFQCACIRSPSYEHGTHYHRPDCKFYSDYDGKDDKYREKCTECKRLGKLCPRPKKLRKPRLVDKDEVE